MRVIIAAAAATLLLAFTAHGTELQRTEQSIATMRVNFASSCAINHRWLTRVAYIPNGAARCAQFLATGNVLHTRHWSHT